VGFNETLKTITDFIAELNKSEANDQQKKILNQMRRIQREIKQNQKRDRIYLIISIIASVVGGFFLEKIYNFLTLPKT